MPGPAQINAVVTVFGGLITAGVGAFVLQLWKEWRSGTSRSAARVNENISAVAMARDELIEDNARLRQELLDQAGRHDAERARWLQDQNRLREDIARLEQQIQTERAEANRRYEELWATVQTLRRRAEPKEEGP